MKTFLPLTALLCVGSLIHAQDKATLSKIVSVFDQIESEHTNWAHYSYAAENLEGGQSYQHHVWKSEGDEGLIKVESLNFDDHGESRTQFFFKGSDLIFSLDRSETSLMIPNAPNEVTEKRYYFAEGQLIRLLEKKGKFPAGQATDTKGLKNRELPLSELENASETYTIQHEIAAAVIEKARRMDSDVAPDEAPPAPAAPGMALLGDGWRFIAGSAAPNGLYGLAWGVAGESAPQGEADEDGTLSVEPGRENLINYVVNLRTHEIISPIAAKHFGDKTSYNTYNSETVWTRDSNFFVQVNSEKWETAEAYVHQILEGGTGVSEGTDIIKPASAAVFKHLKGTPQLKKFEKGDYAISLSEPRLFSDTGTVVLQVSVIGQVPKNEDEDSYFNATVIFNVNPGENNGPATLEWVSTERKSE